ncbi:hypothetical protein [Sphingomonas yantingensis]|uniref:Uncharacterized protein n=1 Tax=Sphingomonas yantingensis TaxID=1241761 RepID=A0A7W9ASQ2_9SPHN|nr:hypothetical protein [Sphingomonas yantingensis]MBB5699878.1 hypothetical protein [Sphingomonas yantingensis]
MIGAVHSREHSLRAVLQTHNGDGSKRIRPVEQHANVVGEEAIQWGLTADARLRNFDPRSDERKADFESRAKAIERPTLGPCSG